MGVDTGLDALAGHYLGQDWDLFGSNADDILASFAVHHREDIPAALTGLETLVGSSMSEDELLNHWVFVLHGGYDPRDDGYTYREWFAHALDVLRTEAAKPAD